MRTYDLGKNKSYAIYSAVRGDILGGVLKKGERLPSKRVLAADAGVSVITVQTAYDQLLAEGYITSKERSGYFVADVDVRPRGERPPAPCELLAGDAPQEYEIDLVAGSTPAELFPFSVWTKLMRKVLAEEGSHLLQRVPAPGDIALRSEIAGYLYRARGVNCPPERIIVGAGAEYFYGMLVSILGRDKLFAVEDPGHGKIASTYALGGARCAFIPVYRNGVDLKAVESSNADVLHISPSHQFPTGAVTPAACRVRLINWARERGAYIVEDDYDSEFRLSGMPLQSMLGLDPERVIYINTFSKSLAPSMRMGYMILPESLALKYYEIFSTSANVVPLFEQKTLAAMIGEGHFERHINRLKNYYRNVRQEVLAAIASVPYKTTAFDTGAGMHIALLCSQALSDESIKQTAAAMGIRIKCLTDYLRSSVPGYEKIAVVNYSGLKKGQAAAIADKFAKLGINFFRGGA